MLFKKQPLVPHNHVTATPTTTVVANKDTINTWCTWVVNAIEYRLKELTHELSTNNVAHTHEALDRLHNKLTHLKNSHFEELDINFNDAEQDVVLLMQWTKNAL